MGCDIHAYKEKFIDGKWVTADEWVSFDYGDEPGDKGVEVPWKQRFTDRNYELFGVLSKGVRRVALEISFEPRGIPFDACPEIKAEHEKWGEDGHSASYLYLHELKALQNFLSSARIPIKGMKSAESLKAFKESIASESPNWDLVFPYCGWTSASTYEEFECEVPADFYIGKSLQTIISGFDGIDGENHRMVFFFDN